MTKYYIACQNRKKCNKWRNNFFLFSVPVLLKCNDVFFKNTLFSLSIFVCVSQEAIGGNRSHLFRTIKLRSVASVVAGTRFSPLVVSRATTRWPLKRTNGLDFMHGDNFIMIYRLSLEKLALEWTRASSFRCDAIKARVLVHRGITVTSH